MKHKGTYDTVFYIKDPLLRLLVLLLCLIIQLGIFLTILHIILTIISYIEVANRLPNIDETRLGKLSKFLSKYI